MQNAERLSTPWIWWDRWVCEVYWAVLGFGPSVGPPLALLGLGDEVVGEGDGLVVVFVGVVVHSVIPWGGFSESYVGEFIKKLRVLGECETMLAEEQVDRCGKPTDAALKVKHQS